MILENLSTTSGCCCWLCLLKRSLKKPLPQLRMALCANISSPSSQTRVTSVKSLSEYKLANVVSACWLKSSLTKPSFISNLRNQILIKSTLENVVCTRLSKLYVFIWRVTEEFKVKFVPTKMLNKLIFLLSDSQVVLFKWQFCHSNQIKLNLFEMIW